MPQGELSESVKFSSLSTIGYTPLSLKCHPSATRKMTSQLTNAQSSLELKNWIVFFAVYCPLYLQEVQCWECFLILLQ